MVCYLNESSNYKINDLFTAKHIDICCLFLTISFIDSEDATKLIKNKQSNVILNAGWLIEIKRNKIKQTDTTNTLSACFILSENLIINQLSFRKLTNIDCRNKGNWEMSMRSLGRCVFKIYVTCSKKDVLKLYRLIAEVFKNGIKM